jgi:hypothetical protein
MGGKQATGIDVREIWLEAVDWSNLAQNRDHRWSVGSTVTKF